MKPLREFLVLWAQCFLWLIVFLWLVWFAVQGGYLLLWLIDRL